MNIGPKPKEEWDAGRLAPSRARHILEGRDSFVHFGSHTWLCMTAKAVKLILGAGVAGYSAKKKKKSSSCLLHSSLRVPRPQLAQQVLWPARPRSPVPSWGLQCSRWNKYTLQDQGHSVGMDVLPLGEQQLPEAALFSPTPRAIRRNRMLCSGSPADGGSFSLTVWLLTSFPHGLAEGPEGVESHTG